MDNPDSDDYELMSSHELDDLRREVSLLKNNSLKDGDKARVLIDSMDRLVISINRLITILDDAQKDIIDEYQESKPAEKLNQLLEQNQAIAKALIAMSDNLNNNNNSGSRSVFPPATSYQNPVPQQNMLMGNSRPNSYSMNQSPSLNPPMFSMPDTPPSMNSMNDLPPMDTIPPLDNPSPIAPKKKFLGIM
jgi:hypothetical protein